MKDYDDKDLVIVAVFLLCLAALIVPANPGALNLVENGFSGLFGIAVGRATKR